MTSAGRQLNEHFLTPRQAQEVGGRSSERKAIRLLSLMGVSPFTPPLLGWSYPPPGGNPPHIEGWIKAAGVWQEG